MHKFVRSSKKLSLMTNIYYNAAHSYNFHLILPSATHVNKYIIMLRIYANTYHRYCSVLIELSHVCQLYMAVIVVTRL